MPLEHFIIAEVNHPQRGILLPMAMRLSERTLMWFADKVGIPSDAEWDEVREGFKHCIDHPDEESHTTPAGYVITPTRAFED